jgi:hypothetical protein
MTNRRKRLLRALLCSAVLGLVVGFLGPAHVHRHEFDRALITWIHDRSPQNETAMREQAAINQGILLKMHLTMSLIFFVAFATSSALWIRLRTESHQNGPLPPAHS